MERYSYPLNGAINQDQPLDQVDFPALAQRLAQYEVQAELIALWIDRCLRQLGVRRATAG